jgi:hypothetical protein
VAWTDDSAGNADVYLKRWDGRSWSGLGSSGEDGGLSRTPTTSGHPAVALDPQGRPVVAWNDSFADGSFSVYVRRWDGSAWVELGGSATGKGISGVSRVSCNPAVGVGPDGAPVVAWRGTPGTFASVQLRRWDGASWVELGGSATGDGVSGGEGEGMMPALVMDPAGRPIVAWGFKTTTESGVRVRRWNGTSWEDVGPSLLGEGSDSTQLVQVCLVLDPENRPVLAWQYSLGDRRRVHVRRFDGRAWTDLGGFWAQGDAPPGARVTPYRPALAVDASGTVFLALSDRVSGTWQVHLWRQERIAR